jgi:hypothetical protein
MKKLLILLFTVCFFTACSGDDPIEQTQNYTSFIISGVKTNIFINTKSAYFNEKGECILLGEHGTLQPNVNSDEFIMTEFRDSIYLFYDYGDGMRLEKPFRPQKNKKNNFVIAKDAMGIDIMEKTIYNWPH